jgi:hypothetical protein
MTPKRFEEKIILGWIFSPVPICWYIAGNDGSVTVADNSLIDKLFLMTG